MGKFLALFFIFGSEASADGHIHSRLSVVQFCLWTLLNRQEELEVRWGMEMAHQKKVERFTYLRSLFIIYSIGSGRLAVFVAIGWQ